MLCLGITSLLLLQAPAPAQAAPPQAPPPSRLIELPRIRPTRADNARENLAVDPSTRKPAEADAAAAPEPTPEELEPPAPPPAPAPAPVPAAPPPAPAAGMGPAPATPAPAGARARGGISFDPRLVAPLTALVGPVIGALWLVSRRGVGTPAE